MILLIIILLLVFGFGGYRYGGPDYGVQYGGGGIGLVLIVLLILYLLGAIGGGPGLRLR